MREGRPTSRHPLQNSTRTWWSNRETHTSHTRQCLDRATLGRLQVEQGDVPDTNKHSSGGNTDLSRATLPGVTIPGLVKDANQNVTRHATIAAVPPAM